MNLTSCSLPNWTVRSLETASNEVCGIYNLAQFGPRVMESWVSEVTQDKGFKFTSQSQHQRLCRTCTKGVLRHEGGPLRVNQS